MTDSTDSLFIDFKPKDFSLDAHDIERPLKYCKASKRIIDAECRSSSPFLPNLNKDIKDVFQHYCASTDDERKQIFNTAYVFPQKQNSKMDEWEFSKFQQYVNNPDLFKTDLYSMDIIPVNASMETIKIFSQYLCDMAKLGRKNKVSENYHSKVIFLTGDIGVGKSFLVNYILSYFQDDIFEANKIITVKIDLGNPNQPNENLQIALWRNFIKILKNKYFSKVREQNRPRLDTEELSKYLEETNQQQYEYVVEELTRQDSDITLSLEIEQLKDAYRILKNFVSHSPQCSNHYKFLIIIDGLDNFNRDLGSGKEFKERVDQLINLVLRKEGKEHCYLLVTRMGTYLELRHLCDKGSGNSPPPNKMMMLYPVDPVDVVRNKIVVFKNFLALRLQLNEEPINTGEKEIIKFILENLDKFSSLIVGLVDNIFIRKSHKKETIELFFNNNLRDIVEFYNVVTRVFLYLLPMFSLSSMNYVDDGNLKNKIKFLVENQTSPTIKNFYQRYSNLFFTGIMANRMYFTLDRYCLVQKGYRNFYHSERNVNPEHRSLLPNLLYIEQRYANNLEFDEIVPYMLKIRILQLFQFKEQRGDESCDFDNISKCMKGFLGYNYNMSYGTCHMLYAEQLLCRDTLGKQRYRVIKDGKSYGRFQLTSKGKYLLNNLLFRIEYLYNLMDNIYLAETICKYHMKPYDTLLIDYEAILVESSIARIQELQHNIGAKYAKKIEQLERLIYFYKLVEERQISKFQELTTYNYFSFKENDTEHRLLVWPQIERNFKIFVQKQANYLQNNRAACRQFEGRFLNKYL